MRSPRRLDGVTALAGVQRASLSAAFCSKLRTTLEEGEAAVNQLIRTYDADVADHHQAVSRIALRIAEGLGLAPDVARGIGLASSIHDIGTIGVTATDGAGLHTRPGSTSTDHPRAGASIVDGIRFPWPIAVMILQHHECIDGSGYPDGVAGRSIILGARVIAVADVVADGSDRVLSPDGPLAVLDSGRGSRFDAEVVDICLDLFPRVPLSARRTASTGP